MLKLDDFTQYIEQNFSIEADDQTRLDARLIEAKDLGRDDREHVYEQTRRPFSLLLKTDKSVFLQQKLYKISHQEMGEFGLFLVPIYDEPDGYVYEAMFN